MSNSGLRTVVGIIEDKLFSTNNGNRCSYVDVGFERFPDEKNPKLGVYKKINMGPDFFSQYTKVFLTSDADNVLKKYGGMLVEMAVGESPDKTKQCEYTVDSKNIHDIPSGEIIEIIEARVPDMTEPAVTSDVRPTTPLVMLESTVYEINSSDFFFMNDNSRHVYLSLDAARESLWQKYADAGMALPPETGDLALSDDEEETIVGEFIERVHQGLDDYLDYLDEVGLEHDFNEERLREVVAHRLNQENQNNDVFVDLVADSVRAAQRRWAEEKNKYDKIQKKKDPDSTDVDFRDYVKKIRSKKVLVGPFVVKSITQGEGVDSFCFTISVPDRGPFKTKDECNATTRRIDLTTVEEYIVPFTFAGRERRYVVQMKNWQMSGEKLDVIAEKQLIDKFCFAVLSQGFSGLKPQTMSLFRNNLMGNRYLKDHHDRALRALDIIASAAEYDSQRQKLFSEFSKDKAFSEYISNYVSGHIESILAQYAKSKLKEINQNTEKQKAELEKLESQINAKKAELSKLNKNYEKLSDPEYLNQLKKQAAAPTEDYANLSTRYRELRKQHETLEKEVGSLSKTRDSIRSDLTSDLRDLDARYLEMHSMLKAFTSQPKSAGKGLKFDSPEVSQLNLDNISKCRNRYIEDLLRSLKSMDRPIDKEKLISMVITIAQNQFTVLAGLPGSGKTSFVKCMGKALNLGSRLHTIPVARGWTSQRDILGYWNSLAGTFQPAPTGLWELMTTLDSERDPTRVTPAFLLLDEMNLSSPEHYFSSFLDLADGESERRIFTGVPERSFLNVPEYFHFIGTVNSDDTVNIMSPRMLDRSAVILFDEKPSQGADLRKTSVSLEPMKTYSADNWMALFRPSSVVDNLFYQALNSIEETLYDPNHELGQRVVISYRKHQQILNFLSVAKDMMEPYRAMDYAVKQFVLPMIAGMGEGFLKRLENLGRVFEANSLTDSQHLLEDMIAVGNDHMNSYQFLG